MKINIYLGVLVKILPSQKVVAIDPTPFVLLPASGHPAWHWCGGTLRVCALGVCVQAGRSLARSRSRPGSMFRVTGQQIGGLA